MNIATENENNANPEQSTGNKKITDTLWIVFAIIFVVVFAAWMILGGTGHIEDTNGPNDYSLNTITDENIKTMDLGSTGAFGIEKLSVSGEGVDVSSALNFSANKFTGVTEIFYDNYISSSDFYVEIFDYTVESGNVQLCVVRDNKEIVAVLEPDTDGNISYKLDNVKGSYALRIAGESAKFSFSMFEVDYDYHTHDSLNEE